MKAVKTGFLALFLGLWVAPGVSAQTASGPPVEMDGRWEIWCERTHNDSNTDVVVYNDGFQVFGYFSVKGESGTYPVSSNTCYVRNRDAMGRSLRIVEVYPTGEPSVPGQSCNTSYVGKIAASTAVGAGAGFDEIGNVWSFNISILKNAPCAQPMLWMEPGVIHGYIRFKEQFGDTEFTLPVTFLARE